MTRCSDRFTELRPSPSCSVGVPLLTYLTRWRMYRARALLRDGQARMSEVLHLPGYSSETAFSMAFEREVGVALREFKRAAAWAREDKPTSRTARTHRNCWRENNRKTATTNSYAGGTEARGARRIAFLNGSTGARRTAFLNQLCCSP